MNVSISQKDKQWLVVYTKSRFEKKVVEQITKVGIEVYCPLKKTKKQWSDRTKWIDEPLFKSYVFVHVSEQERIKVLQVFGVVRFLYWLQKPAVVKQKEIDEIKRWLNEYDHSLIEIKKYLPGDRVVIKSGSFIDIEGEVVGGKKNKVRLYIEALGLAIEVNTKKTLVQKV
jgi:transcriptional antiterminator RfaH